MAKIPKAKREWAESVMLEFNNHPVNQKLGCSIYLNMYEDGTDWSLDIRCDRGRAFLPTQMSGHYKPTPKNREESWEYVIRKIVWDSCLFLWSDKYKKVVPPKECIHVMGKS
jgi:hypothetical protein